MFKVILIASALSLGGILALFQVAQDQPTGIRDIGSFKVGFERGVERASFSGRAMVQIFVPDNDPELFDSLAPLLSDPEIEANMRHFTGIIIPLAQEVPLTDADRDQRFLAEEAKIQQAIEANETLPEPKFIPRFPWDQLPVLVIQTLRGPLLAVLQGPDLTVKRLVEALQYAEQEAPPVKSPLYEQCEADPRVFDRLIQEGERETVRIARDSLGDIAKGSPEHIAAEQALLNSR